MTHQKFQSSRDKGWYRLQLQEVQLLEDVLERSFHRNEEGDQPGELVHLLQAELELEVFWPQAPCNGEK